jgi:hypothetical protein
MEGANKRPPFIVFRKRKEGIRFGVFFIWAMLLAVKKVKVGDG